MRNGLKSTWYDWRYGTGSLIIIDVSTDICLEPDQASGMANQYTTLQVGVTLRTSPLQIVGNATATAYDLYTVVSQNGKCAISKSECQFLLQGPDGSDVLAATSDPNLKINLPMNPTKADSGSGGSIFGGIGKLLSKGIEHLANNPHHLKAAHSALKSLVGGQVAAGGMAGGALHKKKPHKRVY